MLNFDFCPISVVIPSQLNIIKKHNVVNIAANTIPISLFPILSIYKTINAGISYV